jgi:hypothetical protein
MKYLLFLAFLALTLCAYQKTPTLICKPPTFNLPLMHLQSAALPWQIPMKLLEVSNSYLEKYMDKFSLIKISKLTSNKNQHYK